jgi:hypothetical protein
LTQAKENKCNDNARNEKELRHFGPSDKPGNQREKKIR